MCWMLGGFLQLTHELYTSPERQELLYGLGTRIAVRGPVCRITYNTYDIYAGSSSVDDDAP